MNEELRAAVRRLMEEAEYLIACAEAPQIVRQQALLELSDWLADLRVVVLTEKPMADSDAW